MSRLRRVLILGSGLAAGLLVAAAAPLAQTQVVVFEKLKHSPIGGALLRLDAGRHALDVLPSDPQGGDGVAIALPETKSWTSRMSVSGRTGPALIGWDAIADGARISTASWRQNGDRFEVRAGFTGGARPTYSAQVYADGKLVGSVGGVPPTAHLLIPVSFCYTFPEIFDCGFTIEFHNSANSECEWRYVLGTTLPITLPNGVVATGNEVRLVEEVNPAGHYPYLTFDMIAARSNTNQLTLFSETVQ